MFQLMPFAYVFEIIQVLLAVLGWILALIVVLDSHGDAQALKALKLNGRSAALAKERSTAAHMILAAQTVLIVAGLCLIWLPPPPPFSFRGIPWNDQAFSTLTAEVAVFFVTLILTVKSVSRLILRKKIPLRGQGDDE